MSVMTQTQWRIEVTEKCENCYYGRPVKNHIEREKRGCDDPYGLKTQDGRRLVIHLETTEFEESK